MYAKNIKLICFITIISLIFIIAIYYSNRNSAEIESISAIENVVTNKIDNKVDNKDEEVVYR